MYYYEVVTHLGVWDGSCDATYESAFDTFEEAVEWAKAIWPYDTAEFKEWKHDQGYEGWVYAHTEHLMDGGEDYIGILRRVKSS